MTSRRSDVGGRRLSQRKRQRGAGGPSDGYPDDLPTLPVENPAEALPQAARELLDAAKKLLLQGGFEALRLDSIVREAGKNKASVKYYFGNKDGLILAIIDSLDHEMCLVLAEQTSEVAGEEHLRRFIDGKTSLATNESFLMFFDLLPYVLRDDRLRPRLASLYDWYYEMNLQWLGLKELPSSSTRRSLVALASLMVAIVDGLAIQDAIHPSGFKVSDAFAVLEFFLRRCLPEYLEQLPLDLPEATPLPSRP